VICFDTDRFAMDFQRPDLSTSGSSSVSISGGGAMPLAFGYSPAKANFREQWVLRLPPDTIQSLLDNPQVELTETSLTADENGFRTRSGFPTIASRLP
jgi:hypothetical protein